MNVKWHQTQTAPAAPLSTDGCYFEDLLSYSCRHCAYFISGRVDRAWSLTQSGHGVKQIQDPEWTEGRASHCKQKAAACPCSLSLPGKSIRPNHGRRFNHTADEQAIALLSPCRPVSERFSFDQRHINLFLIAYSPDCLYCVISCRATAY